MTNLMSISKIGFMTLLPKTLLIKLDLRILKMEYAILKFLSLAKKKIPLRKPSNSILNRKKNLDKLSLKTKELYIFFLIVGFQQK